MRHLILCCALSATCTLAGAAPALGGMQTINMPFLAAGQLMSDDGSPFNAAIDGEPVIEDGAVTVPPPWPNVVDVKRYAREDAPARFYFTTANQRRLVQRIDLNDAETSGSMAPDGTYRFKYDGAGNLTEQSLSIPAVEGRAATVTRSCFVYDAQGRLAAHAAGVESPGDCARLGSDDYYHRYIYNDAGDLERVIEQELSLKNVADIQRATRSLRVTAYDTAGKPVASFSNASGSPARLPLSDENGGVAPRMAILATDGNHAGGRVPAGWRGLDDRADNACCRILHADAG